MKRLMILSFYLMTFQSLIYTQTTDSRNQPNIIFIMADDLGYGDLSCYGQKYFSTPVIDQLASEGILFTQAYAGAPVCTPSRSVLMTGLHNGHTPARDNIPHYHTYLKEEDVTAAEILQDAGYRTGGVGKWSLGDAGTVGRATNQGFDFWLGYLNQDHAHYYYTEYLDYNNDTLDLSGNTFTREFYSHDILTNGALQFIRDSQQHPFFLYVAFTIPHYSSKSEDEDGLTVPNIKEEYQSKDWPKDAKKYATMIDYLDRDVGKIMQLVKDLGLDNNTLIIVTSDNGGHHGVWRDFNTSGSLRGYKRDLTEGGIRVPFIARWPGMVPENTTNDEIIGFQDMLPTFAELAGSHVPNKVDGISILNALKGEKIGKPHQYLYWDYGHARKRYDQAIRMDNWKGIRYGVGGKINLYDLSKDIHEDHDVADEYPEIVAKMNQYMNESFTPDDQYRIGDIYKGSKIWNKRYLHMDNQLNHNE